MIDSLGRAHACGGGARVVAGAGGLGTRHYMTLRMHGCVTACVRSVLGAQGLSLGTGRACALGPYACVP